MELQHEGGKSWIKDFNVAFRRQFAIDSLQDVRRQHEICGIFVIYTLLTNLNNIF